MKRVLVIGDVHGCLEELKALIAKVQPGPQDTVVMVGDLVDKGPDPMGVLRYCQEQGFVLVRGNHDDKHLRYYRGVKAGREASKLPKLWEEDALPLTESDEHYISTAPLFWQDQSGKLLVVHAGMPPWIRTLDKGGSKDLMYCRYITPRGVMTQGMEHGPDDVFHADLYDGRFGFMLFGHEAFVGDKPALFPYAAGVDLGCVYGGSLCCAVCTVGAELSIEYVTVPAGRVYREH